LAAASAPTFLPETDTPPADRINILPAIPRAHLRTNRGTPILRLELIIHPQPLNPTLVAETRPVPYPQGRATAKLREILFNFNKESLWLFNLCA
jgi:hypothetical protein